MLATNEGGCLVDAQGLAELVGYDVDALDEVRAAMETALEAGCERCQHGLLLWVDLAVGESFDPRPGFRIGGDLDLMAGPAMGAGRAPWTRAGLAAIERCRPAGALVGEVGAGSGILGLYALRRGALHVDAVDVDRLSVAVARRNARVNDLADRYTARVGSLEALSPPYDLLVVALPDDRHVAAVLPDVPALLAPGARVVISPVGGDPERGVVERQLRQLGLRPVDVVEVEGWQTLIAACA